jgi:hypothetical protein
MDGEIRSQPWQPWLVQVTIRADLAADSVPHDKARQLPLVAICRLEQMPTVAMLNIAAEV